VKLFVITDLEGVAGVMNGRDYLSPTGRYYETSRRLLTLEVNAAIEGFSSCGFDEFLIVDGHDEGAIHLHPAVSRRLIREGAAQAAQLFRSDGARFLPLRLKPPHQIVSKTRAYRGRDAATISFENPGPIADALVERMARLTAHYK